MKNRFLLSVLLLGASAPVYPMSFSWLKPAASCAVRAACNYAKGHKVMSGAVAVATMLMAMPQVRRTMLDYIKRLVQPLNHAIVRPANVSVDGSTAAPELAAPEGKQLTLHDAVSKGDVAAVERLIAEGVDINVRLNGDTPLSCAVFRGHKEIVQLLLDAGALLEDERRLLMYAERFATRLDIFLLLAERMQGFSELDLAILHNQLDVVRKSSDYYCETRNLVYSPLELAAICGNPDIIRAVVERAGKSALESDCYKRPTYRCPIHFAVAMGHLKAVSVLAEAGANLEIHSGYLRQGTPLGFAEATKNQPMIDLLKKLGAKR